MPYELTQISPRRWSVKNSETGVVHSKHTTKAKGEAQIRLLNSIHSLTGKGLIEDKYIESLKNPSPNFPPKVPLPIIGNFEINVPPYVVKQIDKDGKIGYKLVKTLTKTRNLSTRKKGISSIKLLPKTHETSATVNTSGATPTLNQFSKKDQSTIKKLFLNPDKSLYLQNEQRGFPELMPKNIERHRNLGTSKLPSNFVIPKKRGRPKKVVSTPQTTIEDIDWGESPPQTPRTPKTPISFETSVPSAPSPPSSPQPVKKGRGRPKKYETDIERESIKKQQILASNKKLYIERLTPRHKEKYMKKQEAKALKGKGILNDMRNMGHQIRQQAQDVGQQAQQAGQQVAQKAQDVGQQAETLYNKVIHHDTAYPPNLTAIKNELGDEIITSLQVGRTPVPSAISSAMNAVSLGGFSKVFNTLPFDKLFHLFLIITTDKGKFLLEKNERINVSKSIPSKDLEVMNVVIPNDLSVNTLIDTTEKFMGGNFLPYDPANQNCQDFVLSLLKANNILTDELNRFVKQDTSEIFKQNPNLAKISRKLTDIGSAVNVIQQGGSLRKLKSNHINMDTTFYHQLPQSETQVRASLGLPRSTVMMGSGFFDDIGRSMRQTFQPVAEQVVQATKIPTSVSDLTNLANIAQIPTDIGGVKRYGKIGATYGMPALGSALGGAAGSMAMGPIGGIGGATLGGVAGRLAAEQTNKAIDGSGLRRRRGRPRKMSGCGWLSGALDKPFTARDVIRGAKSLPSGFEGMKEDISGAGMRGQGWLSGALDKPFTARDVIRGAKSLPSGFEGMKEDISGAGMRPKKGSPEMKAKMARIREMRGKK